MQAKYIYVADLNNSPCVSKRKSQLKTIIPIIDMERIVVVVPEIEAWYIAGLDTYRIRQLRLRRLNSTENVTKEHFDQLIPTLFDLRIDFMQEILKYFSIETAKQRNKSFAYFANKFL